MKKQFTSAEVLTIVRRGLFAIDDLYNGKTLLWFNLVKREIRKHIDIEDDPMMHELLDEVEETIEISPGAAIRILNKLLMFVSTIETTD